MGEAMTTEMILVLIIVVLVTLILVFGSYILISNFINKKATKKEEKRYDFSSLKEEASLSNEIAEANKRKKTPPKEEPKPEPINMQPEMQNAPQPQPMPSVPNTNQGVMPQPMPNTPNMNQGVAPQPQPQPQNTFINQTPMYGPPNTQNQTSEPTIDPFGINKN